MKIKAVNKGNNTYCGPAVVSSLTGLNTDQAAQLIREYGGRRSVKGCYTHEVRGALAEIGLSTHRIPAEGLTLNQWHRKHIYKAHNFNDVFLVVAGDHFQLIKGYRFICGQTLVPVPFKTDRRVHRRARVKDAYVVSGKLALGGRKPHTIKPRTTPRKPSFTTEMYGAQWGFEIEKEYSLDSAPYYVLAPQWVEEHPDYTYDGDHYCYNAAEARERVDEIVKQFNLTKIQTKPEDTK